MSKTILILDKMPQNCYGCNLHNYHFCNMTGDCIEDFMDTEYRPNWCPLKEVPERQVRDYPEYDRYITGYDDGWDACIDEILGEE